MLAAMGKLDELEWYQPASRAAWRRWLGEHHASSTGVWLVMWRKASGRTSLSYDDAVEEALCVGWIDSKGGKVDDERTRLLMTPRKPGSSWAATNKARVERLERTRKLRAAGRRAIEQAKADGSWSRLDDVDRLVVPDDLASALRRHAGATKSWEATAPSRRRARLEWLITAKTEATRAKRLEEIARLAAAGDL